MSYFPSGSSHWLTAAAALGGIGFMPVYMPSEQEKRSHEIRLRKEKSYEDLLKAAEERDKARGDSFNRNVITDQEGIAPAEQPKKRSFVKRAWNKVLTKLHLKKKSQPVAPDLSQSLPDVQPELRRQVGIAHLQPTPPSSPVEETTGQNRQDKPAMHVRFTLPVKEEEWLTDTSDSGDESDIALIGNGKDQEELLKS